LAKPNWQPNQRDGNRGRGRDYRDPPRDNVVFYPTSDRRPDRPRQDNSKPQVVKQGVNGALRAANLRLLLENAPVREAMALVAEVPLERLEAMSQGALCPDETAFHIERALKLPGKWLDGLNKEVPARTLELLKDPDRAELQHDEDIEDGSPALSVLSSASAQPASEVSGAAQAAPAPTQAVAHGPQAQAQGDDGAASAAVEFAFMATSTEGAETAQETAVPAVGALQALASPERSQAAGKRAATASRRAAAIAEFQLPLSEVDPPSQSGLNETSSMASPELRQQNLAVLLQGKGAKSALARVLHAKPPYVSALLNGRKSLDKELCHGMARALGLPESWFEAPRTAADIPAATLQRLAPLRDAAANADTAESGSDTAEAAPAADSGTSAAAASAAAESSEPNTALAGSTDGDAASHDAAAQAIRQTRQHARGAAQHGGQQLVEPTDLVEESTNVRTTAPVQADLPAPVEPEAQPAAQAPAPALSTQVMAPPALVSVAAPVQARAPATVLQATQQTADFTPVYSQPLVVEGGLAPITEALIKILVLKARQGALSEDKAFDLLGTLRLL
jgi:transcriptional regulator with XRE-family HTH domain